MIESSSLCHFKAYEKKVDAARKSHPGGDDKLTFCLPDLSYNSFKTKGLSS